MKFFYISISFVILLACFLYIISINISLQQNFTYNEEPKEGTQEIVLKDNSKIIRIFSNGEILEEKGELHTGQIVYIVNGKNQIINFFDKNGKETNINHFKENFAHIFKEYLNV